MDRHVNSPFSSKSEYPLPDGIQSSDTPLGQIPPVNFNQIPPIHLSSSNSLSSSVGSLSQTPSMGPLAGSYSSVTGGSEIDRKPEMLAGSMARPPHPYVPSRNYQDPSFSGLPNNLPSIPAQQHNFQFFPRLGVQAIPDSQLRQQVLMRPDPRSSQQPYSAYGFGSELNRSPIYNSPGYNPTGYPMGAYTPISDSPGTYGARNMAPLYSHQSMFTPAQRTQQPGNNIDSVLSAKAPEIMSATSKPLQTKKNSRPKINKLQSDYRTSSRSSSNGVKEHSHDKIYENFRHILGISAPRADIRKCCELQLKSPLEKKLFDLFCKDIAGFIDIFLTYDFFEKVVSELAIYDDTRMMLDSLLCLSSLIFQRKYPQEIDPWCPLKYYERSVNSIRHNLSLPEIDDPESGLLARCLISTNILCIYELFFIAIDSTYVKGAGSILMSILSRGTATKSLLKDSQFYQSCFWATYVCDLILSLKLELPNLFSTTEIWKPLDPIYFSTFDTYPAEESSSSKQLEDYSSYIVSNERTIWWSNKIMLICGEINDFSTSTAVITEKDYQLNTRYYSWLQLSAKLSEYVKNMPVFLKPLVQKPAQNESEFPRIYFDDERTAIITINLKISKILLYFALKNLRLNDDKLVKAEFLKYPENYGEALAIEIAGIMQTYDSSLKVWPVSIHCLRQASKFIPPQSSCHNNMKKLVSKVIQVCQTRSQILTP